MSELYELKLNVKVPLNIVTPLSVKKYQETLKQESLKSKANIMELVKQELATKIDNGEIKYSELETILETVIHEQVIKSLDIFVSIDFFKEWADIIFVLTDAQKEELFKDFETTLAINEFIRGYYDFFGRLRMNLKS
ncbi:MAG: hypothetical protein AB1695_12465 [Stygiobacter sp.]